MNSKNKKNLILIVSPLNIKRKVIIKNLKKKIDFYKMILTTTRPKRPQEIEGKDYYFVSWKQFENLTDNNKLITSFKQKDNYYGVTKAELEVANQSGLPMIWSTHLERALKIKRKLPNIKIIFIAISLTILEEELIKMGVIAQNVINLKIIKAKRETDKALTAVDFVINVKGNQFQKITKELVKAIQKFK
ncbi:MAG: hypothetical protein U9Q72_03640 [Patescibacteria group bacterium]|nr:hypothetical protein [Patescibacteria group bacterium]